MKCGGSFLSSVIIFSVVMTTICHVVALVTTYWLRSSTTGQRGFLNLGLWKACFDNFFHQHENPQNVYFGCHGLYSEYLQNLSEWLVPPWLSICRTLSIISLILMLTGLVMSILLLSWTAIHWLTRYPKRNVLMLQNCLLFATPIVHACTGVFMLLTASIFADNSPRLQCKEFWLGGDDPFANSLSFSWTFELIASILSFLSSGLFVWFAVLKSRDDI